MSVALHARVTNGCTRSLALSCKQNKLLNQGNSAWPFDRTARSQVIDTLREEVAVAWMAAILSREPFDCRIPPHRRIRERISFLDVPGLPRFAGVMTPLGIQTKVVSGIAPPAHGGGGEQPAPPRPSQCPGT
ncbi:MAG: hypothetical protein OXJ64_04105 [Boseongicola sp.]|nr:hypothetical protein [Boseongicola sp.]